MEILCPWGSPQYLIFSSNAPTLLYYSHLVGILAAVFFGLLLLAKVRGSLLAKLFILNLFFFVSWAALDLLLWASNRPDIVLFYWSIQIMLEMFLYVFSVYFVYVFLKQKDMSLGRKELLFSVLLPIIVLLPTGYLLPAIDASYCDAEESQFVIMYTYAVQILLSFVILTLGIISAIKNKIRRKEIVLFTTGILIFLFAFSSGNIIGSITEDWGTWAQSGMFGMPVFIALLTYTIVRFQTFNIKLFGAQALVFILWFLVGSTLFVRTIDATRIIIAITLFIIIILGLVLIRSVRREIEQREKIQKIDAELVRVNEGQKNLLHIVNHQIKGYLSKGRLIFAGLKDDADYGPMPEQAKPLLDEGFKSMTEGVDFVKNFLDAANINKGSYTYKMEPFDFRALVAEAAEKLRGSAEEKGLKFEVNLPEGEHKITGDKEQLSQAVRNLIDNSIRYTPSGSLKVGLEKRGAKLLLKVEDTGVGISEELRPRLFTEGGRGKDSLKININSTGFGLSFVKSVAVAHKGRVWAESEGEGKGSQFYMELPVLK